ncbi:hypothetical protein [Catenovulum sediminis]|uniref:GlyGly-CTERM sorting domain-containing protein n=1 Tax=Catenovulum sediminis TaxID=1740262 RepID=A0ABV1RIG9_9ALTE|nr:hypothetical protein [Catenovulum sediminis]
MKYINILIALIMMLPALNLNAQDFNVRLGIYYTPEIENELGSNRLRQFVEDSVRNLNEALVASQVQGLTFSISSFNEYDGDINDSNSTRVLNDISGDLRYVLLEGDIFNRVEIPHTKNPYRTDMVVLVTQVDPDYPNRRGKASELSAGITMFLNKEDLDVSDYVLAHEIGHTLLLEHDTKSDKYVGRAYKCGNVHTILTENFNNLPQYPNGIFSNPNITKGGQPCGVVNAYDSASVLNANIQAHEIHRHHGMSVLDWEFRAEFGREYPLLHRWTDEEMPKRATVGIKAVNEVDESAEQVTVELTLSNAVNVETAVELKTYLQIDGQLETRFEQVVFAAGETYKEHVITFEDDSTYNRIANSINVFAQYPKQLKVSERKFQSTVNLIDDDPALNGEFGFSNATYSMNQGDEGLVTINRTNGADTSVTLTLEVSDKIQLTQETVTFGVDEYSKTVKFTTNASEALSNESITIKEASAGTITQGSVDVEILNESAYGVFSFNEEPVLTENTIQVVLERSGQSFGEVDVEVAYFGSLTGEDSKWVNFANGQTTVSVNVPFIEEAGIATLYIKNLSNGVKGSTASVKVAIEAEPEPDPLPEPEKPAGKAEGDSGGSVGLWAALLLLGGLIRSAARKTTKHA